MVLCASQYFETYLIHISGLWKNGPIHILNRPKWLHIHILSFDFLYPFIVGSYTNVTVNSLNTKRTSSSKNLSEKYTHIPVCQKSGAFHIQIKENQVSHILFVEKKGRVGRCVCVCVGGGGGGGGGGWRFNQYTRQRWKRGSFGTHIRTMPYIGRCPPAHAPPHPTR